MTAGVLRRATSPVVLLAIAGCAGVVTDVLPAPSGATAPPRAADCHVDFFWTRPDRPYVELAAISAGAMLTADYASFVEAFRRRACELGGDAVIVLHPFSARECIVLKYRDAPRAP